MKAISLCLVHHANQYIITNGYQNREGLETLVGTPDSSNGYLKILELHKVYQIPINLHVSGTLLEAVLWHRPDVLTILQELKRQGLLELIGSSYGQNIMRFFCYEHNLKQLNEELAMYRELLAVHPGDIQVFWPPERVWDTDKLGPVLTDPGLLNGGYRYVLLDDRLLYSVSQKELSRTDFDHTQNSRYQDFVPHRIFDCQKLVVLPISNVLRHCIPPRETQHFGKIEQLLQWLATARLHAEYEPIAIFGDDLEKAAGVGGWDTQGPSQYEALLRWIDENRWIRTVKLNDWGSRHRSTRVKRIEVGTFVELGNHFGAGESYEKWYFDPQWDPYRTYCTWSEDRVKELNTLGADGTLIELAWKQLLTSSWETAWHIPTSGVHGNPTSKGELSPWTKALASHSRVAVVIAEAAFWMSHGDGEAHAQLYDIDNNGEQELILKNDKLFAVFSPRWGGRLVYLFNLDGKQGKMVIGNPCDDWNWMEELHKYMELPPNHPGALTDIGYEHDRYDVVIGVSDGAIVDATLINNQTGSSAINTEKALNLARGDLEIQVTYRLSERISTHTIECGFSPDYLQLLRSEHRHLTKFRALNVWGYSQNGVKVWLRLEDEESFLNFDQPSARRFGHGQAIRAVASKHPFTVWIGSWQRTENQRGRSCSTKVSS